jgi:hypothetical protein
MEITITLTDVERGTLQSHQYRIEYPPDARRTYRRIVALVFSVLGIEMKEII